MCTCRDRKIPGLMCCGGVHRKLQDPYSGVQEDSMVHA